MSNFANAQVTLRGNSLLARAIEGETLTFTRIVMGDGEYSGAIMEAQSLVNQKKELNITKLTRKESIVTIGGLLELGNLTEEFYWRELGVYAKGSDGVEVLYMYGNAGNRASYITNTGLDEKLIDINIVVGNASNISAVIDSSLVFLTEENLQTHDDDENAHPALRVWVQSLFASGDWAKYSQADQIISNLSQLKEEIGQSNDSQNKETIFGRDNKIVSLLNDVSEVFGLFRNVLTDQRAANLDKLDVYVSSRSDKATTDTIKTNIGSKTDTGGTVSAGTVMAKLNAIIAFVDMLETLTATNNTASKTGVLSQKLSYIIDTLIGTTGGTVMAKLDKMLEDGLPSGDYAGKTIEIIPEFMLDCPGNQTYTYTNSKGGLARFNFANTNAGILLTITVDGKTLIANTPAIKIGNMVGADKAGNDNSINELIIPFKSSITFKISTTTDEHRVLYINQTNYINK